MTSNPKIPKTHKATEVVHEHLLDIVMGTSEFFKPSNVKKMKEFIKLIDTDKEEISIEKVDNIYTFTVVDYYEAAGVELSLDQLDQLAKRIQLFIITEKDRLNNA